MKTFIFITYPRVWKQKPSKSTITLNCLKISNALYHLFARQATKLISKSKPMYAPFVVSGILEASIADKIGIPNTNLLEDALNQHLSLSNYGSGLSGIAFIYIATPPVDEIHEECFSYSRKKKELFIQMRLPYDVVEQASAADALHLMARSYLETLREKLPLKKVVDFDHLRFVQDVQHLFESKGWLAHAAVA